MLVCFYLLFTWLGLITIVLIYDDRVFDVFHVYVLEINVACAS